MSNPNLKVFKSKSKKQHFKTLEGNVEFFLIEGMTKGLDTYTKKKIHRLDFPTLIISGCKGQEFYATEDKPEAMSHGSLTKLNL